jgi:hypothetical protein
MKTRMLPDILEQIRILGIEFEQIGQDCTSGKISVSERCMKREELLDKAGKMVEDKSLSRDQLRNMLRNQTPSHRAIRRKGQIRPACVGSDASLSASSASSAAASSAERAKDLVSEAPRRFEVSEHSGLSECRSFGVSDFVDECWSEPAGSAAAEFEEVASWAPVWGWDFGEDWCN